MKYRGKCSGMEDHFDTSGVFEISKFDISKFACNLFCFVVAISDLVQDVEVVHGICKLLTASVNLF